MPGGFAASVRARQHAQIRTAASPHRRIWCGVSWWQVLQNLITRVLVGPKIAFTVPMVNQLSAPRQVQNPRRVPGTSVARTQDRLADRDEVLDALRSGRVVSLGVSQTIPLPKALSSAFSAAATLPPALAWGRFGRNLSDTISPSFDGVPAAYG